MEKLLLNGQAERSERREYAEVAGGWGPGPQFETLSASSATRGPLRPFGFASLRRPDAFGTGASRLCVKQPPPKQRGDRPHILVGPLVLKRPQRRIAGD